MAFTGSDESRLDTHFRFGENWRAFAEKIDEAAISEAANALQRLAGGGIAGKRFLDIGCGSGVHALAALRLGASEVLGVDLDPDSVAASQAVLSRYAPEGSWRIEGKSVFDIKPEQMGCFDVVYSWGVLHHTGNMVLATKMAAELVAPDGLFIFALYRKTWLCPLWKWEKRWYAHASPRWQKTVQCLYAGLFRLGLWACGRGFRSYVANYKTNRGMDFYHDVHDWLGGWPYESISAAEVGRFMQELGFEHVRSFVATGQHLWGRQVGLFGSGCDEYVYRRG
jgi:SAM-dependent methyltransferase